MVILGVSQWFQWRYVKSLYSWCGTNRCRTTNVLRPGLRTIIYLFILTATISTVMLYARKVKKDKSKVLCMS